MKNFRSRDRQVPCSSSQTCEALMTLLGKSPGCGNVDHWAGVSANRPHQCHCPALLKPLFHSHGLPRQQEMGEIEVHRSQWWDSRGRDGAQHPEGAAPTAQTPPSPTVATTVQQVQDFPAPPPVQAPLPCVAPGGQDCLPPSTTGHCALQQWTLHKYLLKTLALKIHAPIHFGAWPCLLVRTTGSKPSGHAYLLSPGAHHGLGYRRDQVLSLPAHPQACLPHSPPVTLQEGHAQAATMSHLFPEPCLPRPPERPPSFKPSVRTVVTWVIIHWAQQKLGICLVGAAREQLFKPILVPPFPKPCSSSLAPLSYHLSGSPF